MTVFFVLLVFVARNFTLFLFKTILLASSIFGTYYYWGTSKYLSSSKNYSFLKSYKKYNKAPAKTPVTIDIPNETKLPATCIPAWPLNERFIGVKFTYCWYLTSKPGEVW